MLQYILEKREEDMGIHVTHPTWGSNREDQLRAEWSEEVLVVTKPARRFLSFQVSAEETGRQRVLRSTEDGARTVADNVCAVRYFKHVCGLVKAILMPGPKPYYVLHLDGHNVSDVACDTVTLAFAEDVADLDDGRPVAEVVYVGTGGRHENLYDQGCLGVTLTFRDRDQVDRYIISALARNAKPKVVSYQGCTYHVRGDGSYRNTEGELLPTPVAWG